MATILLAVLLISVTFSQYGEYDAFNMRSELPVAVPIDPFDTIPLTGLSHDTTNPNVISRLLNTASTLYFEGDNRVCICEHPNMDQKVSTNSYCTLISEDNGYQLVQIDLSHFKYNMHCYFQDVLGKIDTNTYDLPDINDQTYSHNMYYYLSWRQMREVVLEDQKKTGMSIQEKIHYLDNEMYNALLRNDDSRAQEILDVVYSFIAQNSEEHKPSMFTVKYAAIILRFMLEPISSEHRIATERIQSKFTQFYDLIIKNTQFIPPSTELIIIEILQSIDVRCVMKYMAMTSQKSIHFQSFEYMMQQLISTDSGNIYYSVIETFVHYLSSQKDSPRKNWILGYIGNDLLLYTMEYNLELALQLLSITMSYDILSQKTHTNGSSFIQFEVIRSIFEAAPSYQPSGAEYWQQFLDAQQKFLQNYSPERFDPIPNQNEIESIFLFLMQINAHSWSGIFQCFHSFKYQFGMTPEHQIRNFFLGSLVKLLEDAVHKQMTHDWILLISSEIASWDPSTLLPDELQKIQFMNAVPVQI